MESYRFLFQEKLYVNKRFGLIIVTLSLFLVCIADAGTQNPNHQVQALTTHDVIIDANSWQSFPVFCQSGDTLWGEFVVKKDGELYPGDQTEYDLSLLTGIDFLILDEANYDRWTQDDSVSPIFEMKTLVQLTWSIEIPHKGIWYILYVNDSIYMKQIEGNIIHSGSNEIWLLVIGIVGLVPFVGVAYIYWRKRRKAVAS